MLTCSARKVIKCLLSHIAVGHLGQKDVWDDNIYFFDTEFESCYCQVKDSYIIAKMPDLVYFLESLAIWSILIFKPSLNSSFEI